MVGSVVDVPAGHAGAEFGQHRTAGLVVSRVLGPGRGSRAGRAVDAGGHAADVPVASDHAAYAPAACALGACDPDEYVLDAYGLEQCALALGDPEAGAPEAGAPGACRPGVSDPGADGPGSNAPEVNALEPYAPGLGDPEKYVHQRCALGAYVPGE